MTDFTPWTNDVPRDIQDWTIGNWIDEARRQRARADRLQASIQLAIDMMNDDENQDEMSSDAREWCGEVTAILNKAFRD